MKNNLPALIVVLALIVVGILYLQSQKVAPELSGEPLEIKEGKYPQAPELAGIEGYLNTDGKEIKIADYKGNVVLIDFWTYSCINCIRTLPHLVEWNKKYKDRGLVIIGVHTPEFEFEKNYDNVKMAMEKYHIEYPVVQDNNYATWSAYRNSYWPRKYLIDKDGFIRFDHIGEGGYDETEKKIQELLAETGHDVSTTGLSTMPDMTPTARLTKELYAGYEFALPRGQNIGNQKGLQPGKTEYYGETLPGMIKEDLIYLQGFWKSNPDDLQAQDKDGASIILEYTASDVNIVATDGNATVEVFVNGEYVSEEQAGSDVQFIGNKSVIIVNEPQLYNVVHAEYDTYLLKLVTTSQTFAFNAFTFG